MANIIEDIGYWVAAPYGDGWTTFARENSDGTKTFWNDMAGEYCQLDANGIMISSLHPFYVRVKAGVVLNCYDDIWRLVPHECSVYAVDAKVIEGWTLENGVFTPPPPSAYVPIVIPSAVFMARLTDEEAEAIDGAMMARPVRVRSAWAAVVNQGRDIREDQPLLWDALRAEIVAGFGEAKAVEWLARPVAVAG